jgi:hypothetical protein
MEKKHEKMFCRRHAVLKMTAAGRPRADGAGHHTAHPLAFKLRVLRSSSVYLLEWAMGPQRRGHGPAADHRENAKNPYGGVRWIQVLIALVILAL